MLNNDLTEVNSLSRDRYKPLGNGVKFMDHKHVGGNIFFSKLEFITSSVSPFWTFNL
ncbi:MAG: hypothetical protein JEZ06_16340 [Anaerolineaceae bacterium]|nr:hypothetical protein [Anaerolineaceae bacterium]